VATCPINPFTADIRDWFPKVVACLYPATNQVNNTSTPHLLINNPHQLRHNTLRFRNLSIKRIPF